MPRKGNCQEVIFIQQGHSSFFPGFETLSSPLHLSSDPTKDESTIFSKNSLGYDIGPRGQADIVLLFKS